MGSFKDIANTPMEQLPPELQIQFKRILREYVKRDGNAFDRYFFKAREGSKWIANKHHELMDATLERVFAGEIKRLIINIPPGYTKTEKAVINFTSRGMAKNPKACLLYTSDAADE